MSERRSRPALLIDPIVGNLSLCDPFDIPSTSHWMGAAIIVKGLRTKTSIVTQSKTSPGPMLSSLGG